MQNVIPCFTPSLVQSLYLAPPHLLNTTPCRPSACPGYMLLYQRGISWAGSVGTCKTTCNHLTIEGFYFFQHHVTDSSIPVVNGDASHGASPTDAGRTNIGHRILVSALHCLVLSLVKSNPDLSADAKDKIALHVLPDAHHPAVGKPSFLL